MVDSAGKIASLLYSYFVVDGSKTRHLGNTRFRRRGEEQKTLFSFLNKKEPFVSQSGLP